MPAAIHTAHALNAAFATGAMVPVIAKFTSQDNLTLRDCLEAIPGYMQSLDTEEKREEIRLLCEESPERWQRKLVKTINRETTRQYRDHKAGKETHPIKMFFAQGDYDVKNLGVAANGKTRIQVTTPWYDVDTHKLEPGIWANPLTAHLPGA